MNLSHGTAAAFGSADERRPSPVCSYPDSRQWITSPISWNRWPPCLPLPSTNHQPMICFSLAEQRLSIGEVRVGQHSFRRCDDLAVETHTATVDQAAGVALGRGQAGTWQNVHESNTVG